MLPAANNVLRSKAGNVERTALPWPLIEVLLWAGLALAAASWLLSIHPVNLSNDSCQYLSVAKNIRTGNGISTDLVYFDSERSHGRVPAPVTTFPPGYPAAVGLLSSISGGYISAAIIVSVLSFAGTAALLAFALIELHVTAFVRAAMLLLFICNIASAEFSVAALSESMFVFVFTAAIVALIVAWWGVQSRYRVQWVLAGLTLAGFSYWVRYAGLFLICALLVYVGLSFFRHRDRVGLSELFATLIPIGLAGVLAARNVHLVGNWKGGNELAVSNPLRRVLADYVRAQLHLLSGEHAVKIGLWEVALLAGGLGLCAMLVLVFLRSKQGGDARVFNVDAPGVFLFGCAAIYSAGIFYAGLRTVISFGPRMFLPVFPIYLLLLGMALQWIISRANFGGAKIWFRVAVCALLIGYAGVNARDLAGPRQVLRQDYISGLFAEPTANGEHLQDWVNAHIDPSTAIASQDGQTTGYLLHRRTLALVESEYSRERWECAEVRNQMNRFGAGYLILYRHPDHASLLLDESSFAAQAASGQPGCGFTIAAENADVRVLKIEPPR